MAIKELIPALTISRPVEKQRKKASRIQEKQKNCQLNNQIEFLSETLGGTGSIRSLLLFLTSIYLPFPEHFLFTSSSK